MSKNHYDSISNKYRQTGGGNLSSKEVEAYCIARMPATYAAVSSVLKEVQGRIPTAPTSFLDLGAGPGTGLLAAQEIFPEIEKATLVEKNEFMIQHGKTTANGNWIQADLHSFAPTPHDMVLFAYSFGEISGQVEVLKRAWDAAKILVIVEPGTPRGFEHILQARNRLIEWGGKIIAPCPHMRQCPMQGGDWCHFSVRLERSREHRQLKGGELGWEDEKFSYVAFSKEENQPASARILRHPLKQTGNVGLRLCTQEGLVEKTISKKQGPLYKQARRAKWGDPFIF
jgi:ribosomal protein RSM22 (predicted rRNA methylase)